MGSGALPVHGCTEPAGVSGLTACAAAATLSIPLAEKGYYVFPVNTSKSVFEQEGFYDGERIHSQPPEVLAGLCGADAVLYVTITR